MSAANAEHAVGIVRDLFGLTAIATPLPGEHDLNFHLRIDDGTSRVLKLHRPGADHAVLDLQDAALEHIAAKPGAPAVPRLIRTLDGSPRGTWPMADGPRPVRMLSWLEGRPWPTTGSVPEALLVDLGRHVARVDAALADFEHSAMHRDLLWNLTSAPTVAQWAGLLPEPQQATVQAVFERYQEFVEPRLPDLPHQAIHNDANEHNILVSDDDMIAGLIDFGDLVWSPRVCGLAVAAAYATLEHVDPLRSAVPIVYGYDQEAPLTTGELEVVFDLLRTRLAISMCMAVRQHNDDPHNDYLLISQHGVWQSLQRLADVSPELAHCRFRDGCGYEASPTARVVRQHFESGRARPQSIFDFDVAAAPAVEIDLSPAGGLAFNGLEPVELAAAEQAITDRIRRGDAILGIGRYGEPRDIYRTEQYITADGRRRTVHLGVDLFAASGTKVRAPLAGIVVDKAISQLPLDWGAVLILEHRTSEGVPFWILLGHLSPASIDSVQVGTEVSAGQVVASLGTSAENGGWPPHLHIQLLTSLLGKGVDVPGVAAPDELDLWKSISPDPNLILGRMDGTSVRTHRPAGEIARRRTTNLSRALSLSYDEPLHIVRGEGSHLYDSQGRRWLDLVNNVCHVGHCHPRVVEAGQRQMAQLNTNTRYLHDSIISYTRRLVETLPDPLRVVFLVNSGSEANDLALRLARAHTRRRDVLVLDHAYHGNVTSQIDLSPYKFNGRGGSGRPNTTHICELPDAFRGQLRDGQASGRGYAADVRAKIAALPAGPAAFFAESLQGCGGQIVYPADYLAEAFAAVRDAGGICVSDEVQVGFGRIGSHFWGFELQGVVPDIVTMGKPIGNGHPMAAVATSPEIAASFVTGMEYFNTFGGNPVSAEIGLAVLEVIRDERLQAHAADMGGLLLDGLNELQRHHPLIGDVRGRGLFIGVELSEDQHTRAPATARAHQVKEALRARGVLISTDGPNDNVLKIKPPLVISADDCSFFLTALDDALSEVEPLVAG